MGRISKEQFQKSVKDTIPVYERNGGNISATARELGCSRASVLRRMKVAGKAKKPVAAGSVKGLEAQRAKLPPKGEIERYILTSAQNNTRVHDKVWSSLLALAEHYGAEVLVGTYSYNQNAYGKLSVKRGRAHIRETDLWYDEKVLGHIADERRELSHGLVWCGEMNILPTAADPLSGLESYTGRRSGIFPHAKMAMRSVPTMQDEGTKLNYTTGTVTKRNYVQKRAGLVAEHHHVYGGLLVEVNSEGNWWVRQLNAEDDGTIYDLDVMVKNGAVTENNDVEAINWGDFHATCLDPVVKAQSMDMLETLRPRQQLMHDILEGVAINHHGANDPHQRFKAFRRGLDDFWTELMRTKDLLMEYVRPGCETVVVYSNHDNPWVMRWLREHDYRDDPKNAPLFLDTQSAVYRAIEKGDDRFQALEFLMRLVGLPEGVKFLRPDESYTICGKKIECGMHGHLGPNGRRGSPMNLKGMGRKANTGHTHSAGIYDGLYVAGTSTKLRWDYNSGPSSWSQSHIVTYHNGKRAIVTMYNGAWRAA